MARLFDDASSHKLTSASAVVTTEPFTMACWFNSDTVALNQNLMVVSGTLGNYARIFAAGERSDEICVQTQNTTASDAVTSTAYKANTWHHACGVFFGANSRHAYLDGGSKGSDTTDSGTGTCTQTALGVLQRTGTADIQFLSGMMAHAAIWAAALEDIEVLALARGVLPIHVRPESLVAYWPLWGDHSPEIDIHPASSGATFYPLTVTGATKATQGPPVDLYNLWLPRASMLVSVEGGGGGTTLNLSGVGHSLSLGGGEVQADMALAGTGISLSSGQGILELSGTTVSLVGIGHCLSMGSGITSSSMNLEGIGTGASSGSGSMSATQALAGSGLSLSMGLGQMITTAIVDLMGVGFGLSSGAGQLNSSMSLQGVGAGLSSGSGVLVQSMDLMGSGISISLGSGFAIDLEQGTPIFLEGTGLSISQSMGELTLYTRQTVPTECPQTPAVCGQHSFYVGTCHGDRFLVTGHIGSWSQEDVKSAPYDSLLGTFRWSGRPQAAIGHTINFDGYDFRITDFKYYPSRQRNIATARNLKLSQSACVDLAQLWKPSELADCEGTETPVMVAASMPIVRIHRDSQRVAISSRVEWQEQWDVFFDPAFADQVKDRWWLVLGDTKYNIQRMVHIDGLAGIPYAECLVTESPW